MDLEEADLNKFELGLFGEHIKKQPRPDLNSRTIFLPQSDMLESVY
jgi:hypothetical protein